MNDRHLLAALLIAPLMLAGAGCNSHTVSKLPSYSPENPYIPGGSAYVTYEESIRGRDITEDGVIVGSAAGAGAGAILGQVIGGDSESTGLGTAAGAGLGLIIGLNEEDKKRKAHEDHYTRLANQWESQRAREAQAWRDVRTGQSLSQDDLLAQEQRLRQAQRELEERDAAAARARQSREVEQEIRRTDETITTYPY